MKTIVSNNLQVEDYDKELLLWCENNLILKNPAYWKAKNSGRFYYNLSPTIQLFERRGNVLYLPFGVAKRTERFLRRGEIVSDFGPKKKLSMVGDIELYPYQETALKKLVEARNGILEAPCGSGKTQIGLKLIQELGLKALWVTHTLDLVKQVESRAKHYYKGDFGLISDGNVNIGTDITFATVQTLSKLDLSQYKNEWDVIVVDECHRVAGSPTNIMMFYKVLSNLAARHKFGLTATLHRADGLIETTFAMLGDVVALILEKEVGDKMIKAKHQRYSLPTPMSEEMLDTDGTMIYSKLITFLTENVRRNIAIADYIRYTNNFGLVLSHRTEHLSKLRRLIGYGEIITGSTSKETRERIFAAARSGEVKLILSTYNLAKEGLDIPVLDRLYLVTPHKDFSIIKQSVGRIERNIGGKKQPICVDFVDVNIGYCLRAYNKRKNILSKY